MGDNNTNTTTNAAPPQTPSAPLARKRLMVKPKMDFAKALSIMGFSTSRTLDPSGGHDAKVELNAALSRKMADIEKRKRMANKKEQTKVEDKLRDEIRTLHEAYQFLSRKYIRLQELRRAEEVDDEDPDNAGRYYKICLYFWLLHVLKLLGFKLKCKGLASLETETKIVYWKTNRNVQSNTY